ncbi:hypothetical protein ACHHYP_10259 [Achlya hypogyna]|uniref:Protein FAM184A/B N-terminal domain-containing protein n=1 Tax=Achlya hypogyna TaxID=1202772 RepID=A0A1V9YLX6_ACHHY|nr:hypothetical protein ACHHYP_10259 [Achlya hypogyna]
MAGAMDADLQLKMSKKIAQLTKVIFLLNTKNEDAAFELQATVSCHRRDTESLARDAAAKMAALKDALEKKDAQLKSMESLKKLKERHKAEKHEALADFQRYKDDVKRAAKEADDAFRKEVAAMADDVKKMRGAFQDRVAALKTALEAVQAKSHLGNAELQALRQQHTDEVADMVTHSNQKYNDMLTTQLNNQDQLRAQFEAKIASLERAHQASLAQAQEKAELDVRLAVKRRELECNTSADTLKNEMVAKMERLLSDVEGLRSSETRLRSDNQGLEAQLAAARASQKQVEVEFTAFKKAHAAQTDNADSVVKALKLQLDERERQLQLLQDELAKLRDRVERGESDRRALETSLDAVAKARDSNTIALSEKEKTWAQLLENKEAELGQRSAQLKTLETEVKKLRELIKTNDAHAIKAEDDLKRQLLATQKKLAELQATETALNTRVHALKTEVAQLHGGYAWLRLLVVSKEQLDKARTDADAAQAATKAELAAANAAALEMLEKRLSTAHAKQVEELTRSAQHRSESQKTELEAKVVALQSELSKVHWLSQSQAQTAQEQVVTLTKDITRYKGETKLLADQLKLAESTSAKDSKEWKQKLAQLEAQKSSESKLLEKEKAKLDAALTELKALKAKLDIKTKSYEEAMASLKQTHEAAVSEHQATMQASIAKAVAEAERTMATHIEEQRTFLLEMHATDLAAVHAQIDLWKGKVADAEAANAYDRAEFAKLLQSQDEDHNAHVRSLDASHDSTLGQLRAEHAAATAALSSASAAELEVLQRRAQNDLDAALAKSARALEQARDAAAADRAAMDRQLLLRCAEYDKRLEEAAVFHERDVERQTQLLKREKDMEREATVKNLSEQHRAVIAAKDDLIAQGQRLAAERADAIRRLQDDLRQQMLVLENKQDEWKATVKRMTAEKAAELDGLARQHKSELEHLVDENLRETQQLNTQFEKTRALLQEQQQVLIAKVREWEAAYARRDSRVEDLNRISELEQGTRSRKAVAEKDALVQQTIEEMAYIKRELLNREDVYNKTFGRSPNVGVLQVLKPTTLNTSLAAPPKLNRKTKPQSFTTGTKPLPPIGATNQQQSYRDLTHQS